MNLILTSHGRPGSQVTGQGWRRVRLWGLALALAMGLLAPGGARADSGVAGYPYFAKLLGGKDGDLHVETDFTDVAVTDTGDVIVVGTVKSGYLTMSGDIRFDQSVAQAMQSAVILCMDASGAWKWGVALTRQDFGWSSGANAIAVDGNYAYVAGWFQGQLSYSGLKAALHPGEEPDREEEFASLTSTAAGGQQGFIVKLALQDGALSGWLATWTGTSGAMTPAPTLKVEIKDLQVHTNGSLYVCGDVTDDSLDGDCYDGVRHVVIGKGLGYKVFPPVDPLPGPGSGLADAWFAAKIEPDLATCDWVVWCDDRGWKPGPGSTWPDGRESDAQATALVLDDAGNCYVVGAIGGGETHDSGFGVEEGARIYGSAYTGWKPNSTILTGREINSWYGTQSWFLARISEDGGGVIVNFDRNQMYDGTYRDIRPYSVAWDVALVGNQVYVGGEYSGFLETPELGLVDYHYRFPVDSGGNRTGIHSRNEDTVSFDTGPNPDGFLLRCGATDLKADAITGVGADYRWALEIYHQNGEDRVLGLVADSTNSRLYVSGQFGGRALLPEDPGKTYDPAASGQGGHVLAEPGGKGDAFLAAVDTSATGDITWTWATRTAKLDSYTAPDDARLHASTVDLQTNRIYLLGRFNLTGNRPLRLGTQAKQTTLQGYPQSSPGTDNPNPVSFLTAINLPVEPEGGGEVPHYADDDVPGYLKQVILDVIDPWNPPGTAPEDQVVSPVTPFTSPGIGQFTYFKGALITVQAPAAVYTGADVDPNPRDSLEDVPDDVTLYTTRYLCTGYTLGDGEHSDAGSIYRAVIEEDMTFKFNWTTEHKLTVSSEVQDAAGDPVSSVDPEVLRTLGSPDPPTGVHWIVENTEVAPKVTGANASTSVNEYGFRHILNDYDGTGSAPSSNPGYQRSEGLIQVGGKTPWFIVDPLVPGTGLQLSNTTPDTLTTTNGNFAAAGFVQGTVFFCELYPDGKESPGTKITSGPYTVATVSDDHHTLTLMADDVLTPAGPCTARLIILTNPQQGFFVMKEPSTLTYRWRKQARVQLSASDPGATNLPFVWPEHEGGGYQDADREQASEQLREFWFDLGTHLRIGAADEGGTANDRLIANRDKPWVLADGEFSGTDPAAAPFYKLADRVYLDVSSFQFPTSVSWNYSQTMYYLLVSLGAAVDLSDASETGLPATGLDPGGLDLESQPGVRLVRSPAGTTTENVIAWDDVRNQVLPLRPAVFYLDCAKAGNETGTITVQVTAGFPGDGVTDVNPDPPDGWPETLPDVTPDPWRHHVAGTPPVDLDPSATDGFAILTDRFYFERAEGEPTQGTDGMPAVPALVQGDGALSSDGLYTAGKAGRAVLLFSRSTDPVIAASGDLTREELFVRLVETKTWDDEDFDVVANQAASAEIGQPLGSDEDTVGLGTGYLLFDNTANYNPNIYDREAADPRDYGPIIPVNRKRYTGSNSHAPKFPYDEPVSSALADLVVVWYAKDADYPAGTAAEPYAGIVWPHQPELFRQFHWPSKALGDAHEWRIVIASRLGSEGLDAQGHEQFLDEEQPCYFDPSRFPDLQIYNQPDPALPGYNPNEEHALIAPSYKDRALAVRAPTAYALRNDLNTCAADPFAETLPDDYTSDPYVLVQYVDSENGSYAMAVYRVVVEDDHANDANARQDLDPHADDGAERLDDYVFIYFTKAGQPIVPPYPLDQVIGVSPCNDSRQYWNLPHEPIAENPSYEDVWLDPDGTVYYDSLWGDGIPGNERRTFWVDHRGHGWAASGNRPHDLGQIAWPDNTCAADCYDGVLAGISCVQARYFYPMRSDFWWPDSAKTVGDPVPWRVVPTGANQPALVTVDYPTVWPDEVATLKAGETLTYSGGEYHADNPSAPGLPGVVGWAAGEIVYDDLNRTMAPLSDLADARSDWTVRLIDPLTERRTELDRSDLPAVLEPGAGNVTVKGTELRFKGLSPSLQRRVFYDTMTEELGIRGYLNDRTLGDSDLTASPAAVYLLEPNILTPEERTELRALPTARHHATGNLGVWYVAVDALYILSRNPRGTAMPGTSSDYLAGLMPDPGNAQQALPFGGLGPGLAVIPNERFLDPLLQLSLLETDADDPGLHVSYVTLAENNDESLGGAPITLHILRVAYEKRYRGSVKVITGDNAFEERVILRHTGDFGANTGDLVYQWFIREEDGSTQPLPTSTSPDPWQLYGASGLGAFQVELEGIGPIILRDNLVFLRYAHRDETNDELKGVWETTDWTGTKWDRFYDDPDEPPNADTSPGATYSARHPADGRGEWAGAGNSPLIDYEERDGEIVEIRTFRPQLVMGWVKRVLDAINPYEARVRDLTNSDSPATYSSMIQEFGPRYEGPVALNADQDVVENVGLIELYETVLHRAIELSINMAQPANTPGVTSAILLAATRIADFYRILGDEAWTDAMDPTIGLGTASVEYGYLAPSIFSFMNQEPDLLSEELALLRGVDDSYARPVYNRLFWNFTKSQGEAAYVANYYITDVNNDGFIDEDDAMKLYPQGHGDAWGHYLTALTKHYDLLRHPYFNWLSRSELYNLMDIVLQVDYLDERSFARTAAAKARTGAQIVADTYRAAYTEAPDGQWQGYKDTDPDRAWGVDGWARRTVQGAIFDWAVANAILPAEAPALNTGGPAEGIEHIDRESVPEIRELSANATTAEQVAAGADSGTNPLGIAAGAVPFDIDPARVDRGLPVTATHFEQIAERAVQGLANARAAFDYANDLSRRLRQVQVSTESNYYQAIDQDLAFRNRLIEIFGTPYSGMIGAGKPYTAGYDGPDLLLYMYVDRTELESANGWTVGDLGLDYGPDAGKIEAVWPECIKEFRVGNDTWSAIVANPGTELVPGVGWYFSGQQAPTDAIRVELPCFSTGYAYGAPTEWGQRAALGKLQQLVSSMLIQEGETAKNVKQFQIHQAVLKRIWQDFYTKAHALQDAVAMQQALNDHRLAFQGVMAGLHTAVQGIEEFGELTKDILLYQERMWSELSIVGLANAVPKMPIGAPILFAQETTLSKVLKAARFSVDTVERAWEIGLKADELRVEIAQLKRDGMEQLVSMLQEMETDLGDEKVEAIEALESAESDQMLADQYRSTLQEGLRIIEQRGNWHRKLAAAAQQNRYADMNLRVSRNEALRKYNDTFDLAARYVYLAAKAYDYETNFDANDPGSAQDLMEEIVKCRTLGAFQNGQPVIGIEGLGDCLARLQADYAVVRGQMGFNNPQTETGKFSLRREMCRIKYPESGDPDSDTNWRQFLEQSRVTNLWNVWEFRHYCRQPVAYAPGTPLPGLVIPFGTQVVFQRNFFGWPLGGLDHGYDPSNFATKVRSVGLWFTGYNANDAALLAETPRAYLVPAGMDVMTVPTSPGLATRSWSIVNQKIPVPYPLTDSDLDTPNWIAALDGINGSFSDIIKLSSFRVYHDAGDLIDEGELVYDSRVVGRSVWNTRWVLIVPAGSLHAETGVDGEGNYDPIHDKAMNRFIYGQDTTPATADDCPGGVKDIKLFFQTYGHSGG